MTRGVMIPRNLLGCWFGRGKKSDLFLMCQESKRRMLPDWHVIEVTEDTIDPAVLASPYMTAVLERGEFVKATELGRLWALKRFGGVYCDEDVEILRPFDDLLLSQPFFIGYEDEATINGAVVGSIAHGEDINRLYASFPADGDGSEKATAYGPTFLTRRLADSPCKKLEPSAFYPVHYSQPADTPIGPQAYTRHWWAGSWKGYSDGAA